MFQILVPDNLEYSKDLDAFCSVKEFTNFNKEEEYLFDMGSIFKLLEVKNLENKTHILLLYGKPWESICFEKNTFNDNSNNIVNTQNEENIDYNSIFRNNKYLIIGNHLQSIIRSKDEGIIIQKTIIDYFSCLKSQEMQILIFYIKIFCKRNIIGLFKKKKLINLYSELSFNLGKFNN